MPRAETTFENVFKNRYAGYFMTETSKNGENESPEMTQKATDDSAAQIKSSDPGQKVFSKDFTENIHGRTLKETLTDSKIDNNGKSATYTDEMPKHIYVKAIEDIRRLRILPAKSFDALCLPQSERSRDVTKMLDERRAINIIKLIVASTVQKSNSGHPGAAMSLCPLMYAIYAHSLRFDELRDCIILSNGHACAVMYTFLAMTQRIDSTYLDSFRRAVYKFHHRNGGDRNNSQDNVSGYINERKTRQDYFVYGDSDESTDRHESSKIEESPQCTTTSDSYSCNKSEKTCNHRILSINTNLDTKKASLITSFGDKEFPPIQSNNIQTQKPAVEEDLCAEQEYPWPDLSSMDSMYHLNVEKNDIVTDNTQTIRMKAGEVAEFEEDGFLRKSRIRNFHEPMDPSDESCAILDDRFVDFWKNALAVCTSKNQDVGHKAKRNTSSLNPSDDRSTKDNGSHHIIQPQSRDLDEKKRISYGSAKSNMFRKEVKQLKKRRFVINKVTPGHPEYLKNIIDATTGPLGQGIANAVGYAISAKKMAGSFSKVIHCVFGDGCYQEGISHEAFGLASHLRLNNLIFYYDCNNITIDGSVRYSMSDDQIFRFGSHNFHVHAIDGNDLQSIEALICEKTFKIRYPNFQENLLDLEEEFELGHAVSRRDVFKICDMFYVLRLNGANILEFGSQIFAHLQNFKKGKYDDFIEHVEEGHINYESHECEGKIQGSKFMKNEFSKRNEDYVKSILDPAHLDKLMEIFTMTDLFFLAFLINRAHPRFKKIIQRGFVVSKFETDQLRIISRLGTYTFPRERLLAHNDMPTVVIIRTQIADGTLLEGDCKTHGAPLGDDVIREFINKHKIPDRGADLISECNSTFRRIDFSQYFRMRRFIRHLFGTFDPNKTSKNDMRLILRIAMDKKFVLWSSLYQKRKYFGCGSMPFERHYLYLYSPNKPNIQQYLRSCFRTETGQYLLASSPKILDHLKMHQADATPPVVIYPGYERIYSERCPDDLYNPKDINVCFDLPDSQPTYDPSKLTREISNLPYKLSFFGIKDEMHLIGTYANALAEKHSLQEDLIGCEVECWMCPENTSLEARASTTVFHDCLECDLDYMQVKQAAIMKYCIGNMDKCRELVAGNVVQEDTLQKIESVYRKMPDKTESTRKHMQEALAIAVEHCKQILIGSADLTPSCLTKSDYTKDIVSLVPRTVSPPEEDSNCSMNHPQNILDSSLNTMRISGADSPEKSCEITEENQSITDHTRPIHTCENSTTIPGHTISIRTSKSEDTPNTINMEPGIQSQVTSNSGNAETKNELSDTPINVREENISALETDDLYIEDHSLDWSNNYIHYGIREHSMFSIANGIAYDGSFIPITSTFLNFVTYGWHGVRLSALSNLKSIFILTHDSLFLGEDGPTHQPIETIPLLRSTPNLKTLRPCNGVETRMSLLYALKRNGPTAIILSRQKLKNLGTTRFSKILEPYVIYQNSHADDVEITILSTGSEVPLSIEAAQNMQENVRVVSVIDFHELKNFRKKLRNFVVSVEASSTQGWAKYSHCQIGIDTFGISGNESDLAQLFGLTPSSLAARIRRKYLKWKADGCSQLYFL